MNARHGLNPRPSGRGARQMLHCHNLEHEDMAMMADFEVV
ncbi:multicopper oxidase domain-containing protein [Streptosporangium canum]